MTKTLKGATEKFVNKKFYSEQKEKSEKVKYERDEQGHIIQKIELKDEGEPKIVNNIIIKGRY